MKTVIKAKRGLADLNFKEIWSYRELFYFFTWRDIKLRYKQTAFGIAWAVIQPFATMVVFSAVFSGLAGIPSDNIPYPVFVYAGLLLWTIFSNSLSYASLSLIGSCNLIQKIYLPKIIIPASSVMVTLVDFFFAGLVFIGILFWYGFVPHWQGIILLPFLLLIIVAASLGLGWFLAALNVKYRDIRYALPFFIQLLIFVTPVIYPVSIVPAKYQWILALNPMTGVLDAFRAGFMGTTAINWQALGISFVASILFFIFGLWYFLKTEKIFADII